MHKTLLVHIPTERSARSAVDGSISLAAACGAHLDAIAVGYEKVTIPVAVEGGTAIGEIFEFERQRALERAEAALAIFDAEARNANISYSSRAVVASPADAGAMVGASARLHDLTIVSQPEHNRDTYDNYLPQEVLFESGGPVLFVPHTFHGRLDAKRIGICWDGSRQAARALHDAMPLLPLADALTVLTIVGSHVIPNESSSEQLIRYLARAGLPAKLVSISIDRSNIQPAILSLAADENLDMLVMGGYGHSRLQEAVLGGVTREMIRSMTVPTLMSH